MHKRQRPKWQAEALSEPGQTQRSVRTDEHLHMAIIDMEKILRTRSTLINWTACPPAMPVANDWMHTESNTRNRVVPLQGGLSAARTRGKIILFRQDVENHWTGTR